MPYVVSNVPASLADRMFSPRAVLCFTVLQYWTSNACWEHGRFGQNKTSGTPMEGRLVHPSMWLCTPGHNLQGCLISLREHGPILGFTQAAEADTDSCQPPRAHHGSKLHQLIIQQRWYTATEASLVVVHNTCESMHTCKLKLSLADRTDNCPAKQSMAALP